MKKVAIACAVLFLSFAHNTYAMQKGEEISKAEEKTTQTPAVKPLSVVESNNETEYLKFLRTSQGRWKIAGHVFSVTENILDVIAYGGLIFSQALPEEGKKALTYTMVIIGTAKLVCTRLKDVASKTEKDRAKELAKLRRQS